MSSVTPDDSFKRNPLRRVGLVQALGRELKEPVFPKRTAASADRETIAMGRVPMQDQLPLVCIFLKSSLLASLQPDCSPQTPLNFGSDRPLCMNATGGSGH